MNNQEKYDATAIKVLEGIEAVRKRPAMYIGDTGVKGLHHLVYEVVDNSIDEAMAGYCDKILVRLNADGSITVEDNGRGIPVDIHKGQNKPAVEVVMTTLHAGGKFDNKAYKVSGGLHGVGISVVNALSIWLEVEVYKDNKIYYQRYERGKPVTSLEILGKTRKRGTKITFKPDSEIFSTTTFNFDILSNRLRELSFLNKGITIILEDEKTEKREEFNYKGGIISFVKYLNANKSPLHNNVIYFYKELNGIIVEVAFQYNDGYKENVFSFANNINTVEGGTHLSGFRSALTRTLNFYAKKENLIKKQEDMPTGDDYREGLTAVISVKIPNPQFEGQTKTKLGNSEVQGLVEQVVNEKLSEVAEEHPSVVRAIIKKAYQAALARKAAKKARELTRRKNALNVGNLPGKLADCITKDVATSELFIVEGESAGGSAKQGRDRRFQAILPIQGKILNVEKARVDKMLNHNEIQAIITAIGTGIGDDEFDIKKLRYGKIIIMTDADVDGSHIRTLLLTFFFRHMLPLVENHHIYVAQPPLYRIRRKKKEEYVYTEEKMQSTFIELGIDGTVVKDTITNETFEGKRLEKLVETLKNLHSYLHSLTRRGITLSELVDFIKQNSQMPLYKAIFRGESCYLASEKELNRYIREIENNNMSEIEIVEGYDRTGENIINLIEIFEKDEIDHILSNLHSEFRLNIDAFIPLENRFEITSDNTTTKINNLAELLDVIKEIGKKGIEVQRYKGLGEMNPEQLWETTMNPETRTLIKIGIQDAVKADNLFSILMGTEVEARREFIEKNALEATNLDI